MNLRRSKSKPLTVPYGDERLGSIRCLPYGKVEITAGRSGVWFTINEAAAFLECSRPTVQEHLAALLSEKGINRSSTNRKFQRVIREGERDVTRRLQHIDLEAVLAIAFRVNSAPARVLRKWAARQTSSLALGGLTSQTMEPVYATHDIEQHARELERAVGEADQRFGAEIRNRLYLAATGHRARELVMARLSADAPNCGLHESVAVSRSTMRVARNYLTDGEAATVSTILGELLEFARSEWQPTAQQVLRRAESYIADSELDRAEQRPSREEVSTKVKEVFAAYRGSLPAGDG